MSTPHHPAAAGHSGHAEPFEITSYSEASGDVLSLTVAVRYLESAPSGPAIVGVHLPYWLLFVAGSLHWTVVSGSDRATRRHPEWTPTRHGAMLWRSGSHGPGDLIVIGFDVQAASLPSNDTAEDRVEVFARPSAGTSTRASLSIDEVRSVSSASAPDGPDPMLARMVYEHTAGDRPAAARALESWLRTHTLDDLDKPEEFYSVLSDVADLLRDSGDHRRRRDVASFVYNLPNEVPLSFRLHDISSIADSSVQLNDFRGARLWADTGRQLIGDSTEYEKYSLRFAYYSVFELISGHKDSWRALVSLADRVCATFPEAQANQPWFYFYIRAMQIRALFYLGDTAQAERDASALLSVAQDDTLDENYRMGRAHVLLAASVVQKAEWKSPTAYRRKAALAAHSIRLYNDIYTGHRERYGVEDERTIVAAKNVAYAMDRSKGVFKDYALGELRGEINGQLQDAALDVWTSNFGDVDLGGYLDWMGTLPG
ncbi:MULTISPECIES: hypothetical protein [Nocardiaceae]|uniref:Uncharacterized protein n=1 Tax=Rhodococcoides corynebacterioides TaxID=53972 RepID=A0ABS2KUR1_9NOCA|nr:MULTISPECIES: hypothetical protein [Rhodococcus]MBM7415688.1 hypothetical protein [Rhodococcus corynebacterioides]MBP1118150.1 hypothetical protein [Rhodococcus sp. PvP016]